MNYSLHLRYRWRPRNAVYKRMGLLALVLTGTVYGYELGADEPAAPISDYAHFAAAPLPGAGPYGNRVAWVPDAPHNTQKTGGDCTSEGEARVPTGQRRGNPLPEQPAGNCRPQPAPITGGDASAI